MADFALQHSGIIGALCLLVAFALILYRLHEKEERLISEAGFVPAGSFDEGASDAAVRFTGRRSSSAYSCKAQNCIECAPAYLFRHEPSGDEPLITSIVIQSGRDFKLTAVVLKVYGSHFLFGMFKKMLIKAGDLGLEGENMVELDEFNETYFKDDGLFAMGKPGFDIKDPYFIELADALRRLDKKAAVGLGISGRYVAVWGAETRPLIRLFKRLSGISTPGQAHANIS